METEEAEEETMSPRASNVPDADFESAQLMRLLTRSVLRNNVNGTRHILKKINERRLKLTDSVLRDQQTNATVLHVAILQESWDVCRYLIVANKDDDLLTELFWSQDQSMTNAYTEQGRLPNALLSIFFLKD